MMQTEKSSFLSFIAKLRVARQVTALIAALLLVAVSSSGSSTNAKSQESSTGNWKKLVQKAEILSAESKRAEAKRLYLQALQKLPETAQVEQRALILHRLGQLEDDNTESVSRLKEAIRLYEKANAKTLDYADAIGLLCSKLNLQGKYPESLNYLAETLPVIEKLKGKHLELASQLVGYATLAAKANELEKSHAAIDRALALCDQESSPDQKRLLLTKVLRDAASYYEMRKNYKLAEDLYRRAIAEGESLWYPLYSESLQAMVNLSAMLERTGQDADAEAVQDRIRKILCTGYDPDAKDASGLWNGKTAPAGPLPAYPLKKGQNPETIPQQISTIKTAQQIYNKVRRARESNKP